MLVIETPRLILRRFEWDDFDDLHRILSDPITMRFWPAPFSLESTQSWVDRHVQHHREHGFGRLVMVLKRTQTVIGDCGIVRSEVDGTHENDLGYIVFHEYWRQGYASEAAEALKRYGFETLRLRRICANMPVDHRASRRVAEKIGMKLEKQFTNARNRNILTCLYAIEQT